MKRKAIDVRELMIRLNGKVILDNVSFNVLEGEFLTIIGPNGAGKTTLLKTLLGLIKGFEGEIKIFGKSIRDAIDEVRNLIGYVPQKENIHSSVPVRVWDIVALAKKIKKGKFSVLKAKDIREIKRAMDIVNIWDIRNELFQNLSGGQQQRVLIARALVNNPKIMLMDEPFTGVDLRVERNIVETLRELKSLGLTIVFVTHDINEVIDLTDKLLVLNKKVIAFGEPRDVLKEEILSKAYGERVRIVWEGERCIAFLGDKHV